MVFPALPPSRGEVTAGRNAKRFLQRARSIHPFPESHSSVLNHVLDCTARNRQEFVRFLAFQVLPSLRSTRVPSSNF